MNEERPDRMSPTPPRVQGSSLYELHRDAIRQLCEGIAFLLPIAVSHWNQNLRYPTGGNLATTVEGLGMLQKIRDLANLALESAKWVAPGVQPILFHDLEDLRDSAEWMLQEGEAICRLLQEGDLQKIRYHIDVPKSFVELGATLQRLGVTAATFTEQMTSAFQTSASSDPP